MLEFITDREIYEKVICGFIPKAKRSIWLATADLKDLHVDKNGKMVPFLEVLSDLVKRYVEIRLLHAKEPGVRFRRDFDKYLSLKDFSTSSLIAFWLSSLSIGIIDDFTWSGLQ